MLPSGTISARCALFHLIIALTCSGILQAQTIPAFPGAEGAGGYAKGGRGGDVYHVTNLNSSGAGSFAYGLTTGVPSTGRTIVFDVSGYANISGTLRVTASKISIAGQTAPGDGFGVKGGTFLVSGDDVVIRHIRFRDGYSADAIDLDSGSVNSIFDHCDAMLSNDENFSSFGSPPENMTFQWSLNAWGMESHSCGGLWDQNHATCHHSLWAHNHTRNPKARPTLLDWINNVTFDWDIGFILADSQTPANWNSNVIGNYFVSTSSKTRALEKGGRDRNGNWNFHVYLDNNRLDGNANGVLDGTDTGWGMVSGDVEHLTAPLVNTGVPVTQDDPLTAYKKVVSAAGPLRLEADPSKPLRDELAATLLNNLVTQKRHHVSSPAGTGASNGGFGMLLSAPAPADTDRDGMPDYWEQALGFNAGSDDHNTVFASSGGKITGTTFFPANTPAGYTYLEEYLHFLSIPHGVVPKNTAADPTFLDIDLRKFTSGFTSSPVFTISNVSGGTITQSVAGGYLVRFTPTVNTFGRAKFDFKVVDADGSQWTQQFGILISAASVPRDLVWQGDNSVNQWDTAAGNWLNKGSATAFSPGDSVLFSDLGSASPAINLVGTISPGGATVDSSKSYTFSGSGALTGSMMIVKSGIGTLSISNTGPNAFTGGATLNEGTLTVNSGNALGSGALILNGGTLNLGANVLASASVKFAGTATINSSGNSSVAGIGALTGDGTLTVNAGYVFDLRGDTSGFTGRITFPGKGGLRFNGSTGSAAATFDLGQDTDASIRTNATAIQIGALAGGSGAVLSGNSNYALTATFTIGANNLSSSFGGAIQNGGFSGAVTAVKKVGSGPLTLTGASNYTGSTSVDAGTLLVDGSLGATPVTVASGATLAGGGSIAGIATVNAGGSVSPGSAPGVPGKLRIGNGFTAVGAILLVDLSSNPDVAGAPNLANDSIALNGGTIDLDNGGVNTLQVNYLDAALGVGTYTLITGGTATAGTAANLSFAAPTGTRQTFALAFPPGKVQLNVTGQPPASLTWLGSQNAATWDLQATANFSGGNPATFYNLDAVTFDDSSTNRTVNLSGNVEPRTVNVSTTVGYTFSGTGSLAGTAMLIKNGSGTLTIANANSHTGGTIINGGAIILANDAANSGGLGTGPITLNGGTLTMFSNSATYNSSTWKLVVPSGSVGTLNADARCDIYGSLTGGGTLNLRVPYVRTTIFADWSAFAGRINVTSTSAGADFRFGTDYFWPGLPAATVDLGANVAAYFVGNVASGAGTTVEIGELSGTASSVLKGAAIGGRNFTYRIGGKTPLGSEVVFAGAISEQNSSAVTELVKAGEGVWTLTGVCSYRGGTTVEKGTLRVRGSLTSDGSTFEVQDGATLDLDGGTVATTEVTVSGNAKLTGRGTINGDLTNAGSLTCAGTGTLIITGDVVNDGVMRFTGGGTLNATGSFVNNGVLDLLTGGPSLPVNFVNNGVVIDSSSLRSVWASKTGSTVTLSVATFAGHSYQLQRADSLVSPNWANVGTAHAGDGTTRTFSDNAATGAQRFYRVAVTP